MSKRENLMKKVAIPTGVAASAILGLSLAYIEVNRTKLADTVNTTTAEKAAMIYGKLLGNPHCSEYATEPTYLTPELKAEILDDLKSSRPRWLLRPVFLGAEYVRKIVCEARPACLESGEDNQFLAKYGVNYRFPGVLIVSGNEHFSAEVNLYHMGPNYQGPNVLETYEGHSFLSEYGVDSRAVEYAESRNPCHTCTEIAQPSEEDILNNRVEIGSIVHCTYDNNVRFDGSQYSVPPSDFVVSTTGAVIAKFDYKDSK